MRHPIIPKTVTLLAVICVFMLQSCDLYDMGSKDHRIVLPPPSERTYTVDRDGARANDGNPLAEGLEVHPLALIALDDGVATLMQTGDGRRLCISPNFVTPIVVGLRPERLNSAYRHFDDIPLSELKGTHISMAMERWGDYIYRTPGPKDYGNGIFPAAPEDTVTYGHTYIFPNIMLLLDGRYLNGIRLHTDRYGTINDVEPLRDVQRNIFGSLPFYEDILSLNIMEWLMPGPWLGEEDEIPSRGVFSSVFMALVLYLLVVLALTAVFSVIYIPIDRKVPKARVFVGWIVGAAVLVVEYMAAISLLDYYSAGWWVYVIFILGLSILPFVCVIASSRDYCPKCHGHEWYENTQLSSVEMPAPTFKVRWTNGIPDVIPEIESLIKMTSTTYSTCKSCSHVTSSKHTEEVLHKRNYCPKCLKDTLSGEFTEYKILPGNIIKARYDEKCSSCGYNIYYTLNQSCGSAPIPSIHRQKPRSKDSSAPQQEKKRGCFHCPEHPWTTIAPTGANCTEEYFGRKCRYTDDQSLCPWYIPW